ncbi:MAG: hypothetical protein AAF413_03735 [Patescibacteria group bacterium]
MSNTYSNLVDTMAGRKVDVRGLTGLQVFDTELAYEIEVGNAGSDRSPFSSLEHIPEGSEARIATMCKDTMRWVLLCSGVRHPVYLPLGTDIETLLPSPLLPGATREPACRVSGHGMPIAAEGDSTLSEPAVRHDQLVLTGV